MMIDRGKEEALTIAWNRNQVNDNLIYIFRYKEEVQTQALA